MPRRAAVMGLSRREILGLLTARLDQPRLLHSLAAEKEAIRLAAHHGEDWQKAGLAALLHDLCRCDPLQWQLGYLRGCAVRLPVEWLQNPQLWHGPCAAEYIRRELGLTDREILGAVRWHTTGRPGMSSLEKIVFLADKIEPTRSFEGVGEARAGGYICLERAVHSLLGQGLARACKIGLPLVREAVDAYNEITIAINKQKG